MLIQDNKHQEYSIGINLITKLHKKDYLRVETEAKSNKTDLWTIKRIVRNHPYLEINKIYGCEFIQLAERLY